MSRVMYEVTNPERAKCRNQLPIDYAKLFKFTCEIKI